MPTSRIIVSHYPDEHPPATGGAEPPPYLQGSVEYFLPSDRYPRPPGLEDELEKLFVAEIAPVCKVLENPHCLQVTVEELSGNNLGFQERIYLNEEVDTRPAPENFILSKVIRPSLSDCGIGRQLPGDCNQSGTLDISDAICVFGVLFLGSETSPCGSTQSEANIELISWLDNDSIDLSDGVGSLRFLFQGGPRHRRSVPGSETTECVPIVGCPDNAKCE